MTCSFDLTVAAVVEDDDRFLIVEEHVRGQNVLNQPAGHVEAGESVLEAVVRETREETGFQFRPMELLGVYFWPEPSSGRTFVRVAFTGSVLEPSDPPKLDHGILSVHWFTRQQLIDRQLRMKSPMVLRCIDDYIGGASFPLTTLVHLLPECDNVAQFA